MLDARTFMETSLKQAWKTSSPLAEVTPAPRTPRLINSGISDFCIATLLLSASGCCGGP
jgi:hypothetical protein